MRTEPLTLPPGTFVPVTFLVFHIVHTGHTRAHRPQNEMPSTIDHRITGRDKLRDKLSTACSGYGATALAPRGIVC